MSSNQVVPLFGGHTTQQGQKITGSLVRQTKREVEQSLRPRRSRRYVSKGTRSWHRRR